MKPRRWIAVVVFVLTMGVALTSAAGEKDHRKDHEKDHQTVTVFVPPTASGGFGCCGVVFPMVEALTVTKKGKITITYVSGLISTPQPGSFGHEPGIGDVGPDGFDSCSVCSGQFPLQEALGISGEPYNDILAVIGAFVPESQTSLSGFQPIDATKNVAGREPRAGIVASTLFLVGASATIRVNGPGTLFLGINEDFPGTTNNTGGFTMQVTGPK